MKILLPLLLFIAPLVRAGNPDSYQSYSKGGVHFHAFTEGFPRSHTIWSAIGITSADVIYLGVADHTVNAGLFRYDARKDSMAFIGDVLGLGKLWLHEWQGKIHTNIVQDPGSGLLYFGTDAGNDILWGWGIPDQEYVGGHWFAIDPRTDQVSDLGLGARYLGLKSIVIDTVYGRIFSTTDPSSHFLVYDIKKGQSPRFEEVGHSIRDLGCVNGVHEPRMVWADKWGNAYTTNEIGQWVQFVGKTGELRRINGVRLPFAPGTPTWHLASGPSAVIALEGKECFYGITYYGRLFKHVAEETGDGRVSDLGSAWDADTLYHPNLNVLNLGLGKNGNLYYVIGGHGNFITPDSSAVLVEFNPKTGRKSLIYRFDKSVTECTGSVTDSKGRVYFAGHGISAPAGGRTEQSKPYLVQFHPDSLQRVK
jgi:hypothetical protein